MEKHNIEIRKLEKTDRVAFQRYAMDCNTDTSPFKTESSKSYEKINAENFDDWYDEWLETIRKEEKETGKEDYSTATKYFIFADGEIAGFISCRWQIEKGTLLAWGGHIGYGVAPSFRGHHFAEQMVHFALEKYRKRGIFHVMISADEKNIASRKTIEHSGGVLENIVTVDERNFCRYWIDLN